MEQKHTQNKNKRKSLQAFGLLFFVLALFGSNGATAQQNPVTGIVRDANGPLPGVSISVQGTSRGTVSGGDGSFRISASATETLLFSFMGYDDVLIEVGPRSTINVTMQESATDLDEVVVIGYGAVRKRDLTGSVVSVSSEKLSGKPNSNALQALAGQLAGVQITSTQGSPGFAPNIKVRGSSSINSGTNPLYVIDGVPIEDVSASSSSDSNLSSNLNPLNSINPADIESIDILKDASSAAIYGSRGANGVVIITTKQGQAGTTRVEAGYELGISTVARRTKVMNAVEWMEWESAARANTLATERAANPSYTPDLQKSVVPEEFSEPEWIQRIGTGTDWQDVLFRTGITHNFRASVSGGSEKTQFMASAGYLNMEGVVDNSGYERITIRSNLRHKVSDRVSVGLNLSLARMNEQSFGTAGKSDVVSLAVQSVPIFPIRNEVGSLGFKDPSSIWNTFSQYGFQLWHPWSLTREMEKNKVINNVLASGFVDVKLIDGLTFRTALSATVDEQRYTSYWNEGQDWGYSMWVPAEANHKTASLFNWVWENTLNYNKTFGDHAVTGLLGYTVQEQRLDDSAMAAGSFPNDMVHTLNAGQIKSGTTSASEWSMISYLARATYAYQGKYLLSGAIRADGSSRFGANNRWGYFPSAALAWRISEEEFLHSTNHWLDNLKLRVSYGVTGNNQIADYGAIGLLGYDTYVVNNNTTSGMYVNSFADENLKWEKTRQVNVGLDVSLFKSRINLSLDYYYSKTVDMLLNVPIPAITGFTQSLTNIGKMQNKGLELNINTRNFQGDFTWTTDFNISGNRNKVLELGAGNAAIEDNLNNAILRTEVGQPIGNYYGYIIDGVIMSAAEMSQYPVFKGSEPGDPRVRDVAGWHDVEVSPGVFEKQFLMIPDGIVDSDDRTIIGNYQPDFIWGMTNTFTYKNFELSFILQGVHGNEIMNQQARFSKEHNGSRNGYSLLTDFWRSEAEPGNGVVPKPRVVQSTVQGQNSTWWVEDGSFVRIKNISVGYIFPQKFTRKLGISMLKVYMNVENLHVFSNYVNYDPEASTYSTGRFVGLDYGTYPAPRVWTMGVNFNF